MPSVVFTPPVAVAPPDADGELGSELHAKRGVRASSKETDHEESLSRIFIEGGLT